MAEALPNDVLPVLDLEQDAASLARALEEACRVHGFFYVANHGVSEELQARLEREARAFFARSEEEKMRVRMELGKRAWRGYFPVGGELTSGRPDLKEGLYFGEELGPAHPLVRAETPLHGANLFPSEPPGLRSAVLEYMDALTSLSHRVTALVALSLGLPGNHFNQRYMGQPLTLFRIFNYPRAPQPQEAGAGVHEKKNEDDEESWGVGEHTDYGFLTLLKQDDSGGLQVMSQGRWVSAPPLPNTFVCNIGDMLERITGGRYLSTPHRVRNEARRDRVSFPFFFDPAYHSRVEPLELPSESEQGARRSSDAEDSAKAEAALREARTARWDKANVHAFEGTYGDYIRSKVARVFPHLFARELT